MVNVLIIYVKYRPNTTFGILYSIGYNEEILYCLAT